MENLNKVLAEHICRKSPESTSYMDNKGLLWKIVDGEFIGKPYVKDPNHKGHRYIWEEDIGKGGE